MATQTQRIQQLTMLVGTMASATEITQGLAYLHKQGFDATEETDIAAELAWMVDAQLSALGETDTLAIDDAEIVTYKMAHDRVHAK